MAAAEPNEFDVGTPKEKGEGTGFDTSLKEDGAQSDTDFDAPTDTEGGVDGVADAHGNMDTPSPAAAAAAAAGSPAGGGNSSGRPSPADGAATQRSSVASPWVASPHQQYDKPDPANGSGSDSDDFATVDGSPRGARPRESEPAAVAPVPTLTTNRRASLIAGTEAGDVSEIGLITPRPMPAAGGDDAAATRASEHTRRMSGVRSIEGSAPAMPLQPPDMSRHMAPIDSPPVASSSTEPPPPIRGGGASPPVQPQPMGRPVIPPVLKARQSFMAPEGEEESDVDDEDPTDEVLAKQVNRTGLMPRESYRDHVIQKMQKKRITLRYRYLYEYTRDCPAPLEIRDSPGGSSVSIVVLSLALVVLFTFLTSRHLHMESYWVLMISSYFLLLGIAGRALLSGAADPTGLLKQLQRQRLLRKNSMPLPPAAPKSPAAPTSPMAA